MVHSTWTLRGSGGRLDRNGPNRVQEEEVGVKHLRHPATIIAAVALFVAFGGGAAAYASGLISGSQIKNHSIPAKKLTASAIKALHGARGPAGPAGQQGAQGTQGIQGIQGIPGQTGPSSAISTYGGSGGVGYNGQTTIASLALPAGKYVVWANTTIYDAVENEASVCYLIDSLAGTIDTNYTSTAFATAGAGARQTSLSLLAPLSSTGSTVRVDCLSGAPNTTAFDTHITAIKVDAVTGTLGHFSNKAMTPTPGK
jgi:hypothetical protein